MAFISSMAETEKFKKFQEHLRNGNIEGVKENLEPEYVDGIIDDIFGWRPIHLACLRGHLEIAKLLIDNKCNIEIENNWGMRPIHFACQKGHFEIVNLLIQKKCNIESEIDLGMRPIHFACLNGSKEIVKLLIDHNCLIHVSDKDGETPLDKAKSKGHGEIIKIISEFDKITKQINDSFLKNDDESFSKFYKSDLLTGGNWLEICWKQNADKIIKHFLNRPIDDAEIGYLENHPSESTNTELWEEVLLYKSIKCHHEKGFQYLCRPNIINRLKKIMPCSFLELAAENGNFILVQEIMRKSIYDSEIWNRAKEIALNKGFHRIHNSISNREYLLKCREKNKISILHTAVCDNDPEMLEYILRKGLVDANNNHEVLGTALAFAILLCHRECLTVFDQFNIDCNTKNKYLQSPLHEAISNGMIGHCQYIMDHVENIDHPGFMGQSALHCAVIGGCEKLCDQLIEKGADCLRYMELYQTSAEKKSTPILKESLQLSQRENSLTLCMKINRTIYPCFLKSLDRNKANSTDAEGNSLLHLSTKLMKPDLCKVLLDGGANIDSPNKKGNTPLFELLSDLDQQSFIINEDKIIETVNLFVQSGYDLDKGLKGDLSLIQIITKFNSERLCLALLPQHNRLFEIDENLLRITLANNFYQFCETLLNLFPKEHLKSSISTIVIEEALKHDCTHLLKSLVLNASDDVQQTVLEFSLYHLAKQGDKDTFECLLNIEIKNPSCFDNGESLLTKLLIEERLYFCERIIKSKVNKKYINFKNKRNQTPLQVTIDTESTDSLINHLLFETDVIDNMDCEGRTALMQLFVKISDNTDEDRHSRLMNVIKAIICKRGNIYHKTSNGKEVIEFCCSSSVREEIETFQNNQNNFLNPVRKKIIEREKVVVVVKETEIERKTCGICFDREVDSVFECGHTICEVCSSKIVRCPFCNLEPARAKRIYFN